MSQQNQNHATFTLRLSVGGGTASCHATNDCSRTGAFQSQPDRLGNETAFRTSKANAAVQQTIEVARPSDMSEDPPTYLMSAYGNSRIATQQTQHGSADGICRIGGRTSYRTAC